MKIRYWFWSLICFFAVANGLSADEVDMQNGDRYFGQVLSVSSDTVTLDSAILGKIRVPRRLVSNLAFSVNATTNIQKLTAETQIPHTSGQTNLILDLSAAHKTTAPTTNNVNLAAAFQQLGSNTNFENQIREQMLAGSPEASAKYDEMLNSLMSGNMSLNDLRAQARTAADQLRALKQQEGADADSSLDGYLQQLDNFIKETDDAPNASAPIVAPKSTGP